jgi:hypothetical protein
MSRYYALLVGRPLEVEASGGDGQTAIFSATEFRDDAPKAPLIHFSLFLKICQAKERCGLYVRASD